MRENDDLWRCRDELSEPAQRVWLSDGRTVWTGYSDTRGNVAPWSRAVRFWKPFRTPDPPAFDNLK